MEEENLFSADTDYRYFTPGRSASTSTQVLKRPWTEAYQPSTSKILLAKEERPAHPLCNICTKPALMFSSYGGQACSSCRSFFRRSASKGVVYTCLQAQACKISPDTRRYCQHCRYKLCLKAGMKTTWVLSEEEKQRRFKHLKKQNIPTVLDLPFSTLEENKLGLNWAKLSSSWD